MSEPDNYKAFMKGYKEGISRHHDVRLRTLEEISRICERLAVQNEDPFLKRACLNIAEAISRTVDKDFSKDEPPSKEPIVNSYGVKLEEPYFDFSQWEWDLKPIDAASDISQSAARLVMEELVNDAHFNFWILENKPVIELSSFEGEFVLSLPFSKLIDNYIENDIDSESTPMMIEALEKALAQIKEALAKGEQGE